MTKNTHDLYFDFSILPIYICVRTTTLQTSNSNFRLVQYTLTKKVNILSTALTQKLLLLGIFCFIIISYTV